MKFWMFIQISFHDVPAIIRKVHNDIQNRFHRYLKSKFPKDRMQKEYKSRVDLLRINDKEVFFYEINPYNNSYLCIKAALGQLIEYSHLFKFRKSISLIIVRTGDRSDESKKFLDYIGSKVNLNLKYEYFPLL